MQNLEAALAHQRDSIDTFRETIRELEREMTSLRGSLQKLDQNLGKIKLNRLRETSLELASLMKPLAV
jgi:uncharacterized coiled-coil protein SlyX